MIDFDEFMKVDLRVAKIIDAESVEAVSHTHLTLPKKRIV